MGWGGRQRDQTGCAAIMSAAGAGCQLALAAMGRPCRHAALLPRAPPLPAGRLLQLKLIFPGANTSVLAMRQPELVSF